MRDDDDDDDGGCDWNPAPNYIYSALGAFFGCGDNTPQPMSNAGRYLARLKRGDQNADAWFAANKEACEELLCALRRADLKSRAPA